MELFHKVLGFVLILFQIMTNGGLSLGNILVYSQEPPRLIEEEFLDMPAKFGDSLPLEGLRGFVVLAEPEPDACHKLNPPPSDVNFTGKWVVLIARYNCSFEIKIRNAQNAGYDAVIVHNVNSSNLEVMSAKNSAGIKIPSVFVSDEAGFIIESNYLYYNSYFVVINGELPFNINTNLLLPFAVVVGLSLIVMIVFMIVKCIKDRRRARRHRLPYNALKKIPICKFAKGDPYDTCAICLDDYLEGDKLRVLPCAHAYHCKCIDPWLTKNRRVCPVCKRRVFAAGESRRRQRRADPEEGHNGHSSSETDDDRTPLVYPQNNVTQGGTFQEQRENPFVRAARSVMGNRLFRTLASSQEDEENATNADRQAQQVPTEGEDRSIEPQCGSAADDQRSRTGYLAISGKENRALNVRAAGSSCPDHISDRRPTASPADPFLTGVLNMRGDHFAMSRDDDGPGMASQPSNSRTGGESEILLSQEESRKHKNKDRKQGSKGRKLKGKRPRAASETEQRPPSDGALVPEEHSINRSIGVAAIPNAQFAPQPQQRSARNSVFNSKNWKL